MNATPSFFSSPLKISGANRSIKEEIWARKWEGEANPHCLNPSLKPWKRSFVRRSFTTEPFMPDMRWEMCWSSKPRFLLVVYLDLIVCLLQMGVSANNGKYAWHSTHLQTSRPADQRRMLCNKLLCPLKEALGQNSQHWFSSFLSALWDKCQQLIISKPFSKLSIHMWPSSVCKKEKIGGGRGLISPQNVVFTNETSGVLACHHPKPGLFSNLSSQVFQRRELYWFWCGIAGSTASFVCPVLDSELVYPPYRAQIDKCQGGKPRRDDPACVKRCSIKA